MRALDLLIVLALIPIFSGFITYWYGLDKLYSKTTNKVQTSIDNIFDNVDRVVNPDYGLYDIAGGLIGTILSVFGFILVDIPFITSIFVYETANILGLAQIAPFLFIISTVIVYITYGYYIKVILAWSNSSFYLQNRV